MKRATTAERLRYLMDVRGLRQVDIIRMAAPFCAKYGIKLNKNDMSQYLSGKVEPGQNKLFVLGRALNVSEAWLMGFDVPMEKLPSVSHEDSERLHEFTYVFSQLTPEQQSMIVAQIKGLLSSK